MKSRGEPTGFFGGARAPRQRDSGRAFSAPNAPGRIEEKTMNRPRLKLFGAAAPLLVALALGLPAASAWAGYTDTLPRNIFLLGASYNANVVRGRWDDRH